MFLLWAEQPTPLTLAVYSRLSKIQFFYVSGSNWGQSMLEPSASRGTEVLLFSTCYAIKMWISLPVSLAPPKGINAVMLRWIFISSSTVCSSLLRIVTPTHQFLFNYLPSSTASTTWLRPLALYLHHKRFQIIAPSSCNIYTTYIYFAILFQTRLKLCYLIF